MLNNTKSDVKGNHNIVIQNVSDSTITLNIGGEVKQIDRKLEELLSLLEKLSQNSFQSADKTYKVETISPANFDFILNQAVFSGLPYEVKENATLGDNWALSLKQALIRQNIAVNNNKIFIHYGWLIEVFLNKMSSPPGKKTTLSAFSYMTEAYQASLYYLCIIQLAQLIQHKDKLFNPIFTDFIKTTTENQVLFDYQQLLILGAEALGNENFVPEIIGFVGELSNIESDLYGVALYLDKIRRQLIHNQINDDSSLSKLFEEFRTALIFWLRKLAFIAKYKLVSMKEISVRYKLGATSKEFNHLYGELHGIYEISSDNEDKNEDYTELSIKDFFTFNQSVLLFRGTDVSTCLSEMHKSQNYISLSPFIIDHSVFSETITQTPEILKFVGLNDEKSYHFASFKNELSIGDQKKRYSNKELVVKKENSKNHKLNDLYEHLNLLLSPFHKRKP